MMLTIKTFEKWSNYILPEIKIYINEQYIDKTVNGVLSVNVAIGTYKICAVMEGYETNCQNFTVTSDTTFNVFLVPIAQAL